MNPAIHYSVRHQKALSMIPIEKILTESDGDVFYKRINLLGEPSIVTKVLDKICELEKYDKVELTAIISKNFYKYLHN